MNLFVYDLLTDHSIARSIGLQIKEIHDAYINGQLYTINRTPVAIPIESIPHPRGNNKIFGKLYVLDNLNEHQMRLLDAFYACVKTKFRFNHSTDLFHRVNVPIQIITTTNKYDLANQTYNLFSTIEGECYIGNINNKRIISGMKDTHNREMSGFSKNYIEQIGRAHV